MKKKSKKPFNKRKGKKTAKNIIYVFLINVDAFVALYSYLLWFDTNSFTSNNYFMFSHVDQKL